MSKNLCPENNITFENSQQIRFETNLLAGTYTASSIVESTDTDSSFCLMLFYYADGSTKEVYIGRSENGERVSNTFDLTEEATRVRIYASEGYSLSVGDTCIFTNLMIETGSVATDYVPYGGDPEPEPTPEEDVDDIEVIAYWMAMAGAVPITVLPEPTCRETILIRKILDPSYKFKVFAPQSVTEEYLFDMINGTVGTILNVPQSDKEKYLHLMVGGTVEEMPNPEGCLLNFWMSKAVENR